MAFVTVSFSPTLLNNLPADDEERYMWQFILETKMTDIDCALRRMGVSLAQNEEIGNQYIVTIDAGITFMNCF
jgi:hypothetical protein